MKEFPIISSELPSKALINIELSPDIILPSPNNKPIIENLYSISHPEVSNISEKEINSSISKELITRIAKDTAFSDDINYENDNTTYRDLLSQLSELGKEQTKRDIVRGLPNIIFTNNSDINNPRNEEIFSSFQPLSKNFYNNIEKLVNKQRIRLQKILENPQDLKLPARLKEEEIARLKENLNKEKEIFARIFTNERDLDLVLGESQDKNLLEEQKKALEKVIIEYSMLLEQAIIEYSMLIKIADMKEDEKNKLLDDKELERFIRDNIDEYAKIVTKPFAEKEYSRLVNSLSEHMSESEAKWFSYIYNQNALFGIGRNFLTHKTVISQPDIAMSFPPRNEDQHKYNQSSNFVEGKDEPIYLEIENRRIKSIIIYNRARPQVRENILPFLVQTETEIRFDTTSEKELIATAKIESARMSMQVYSELDEAEKSAPLDKSIIEDIGHFAKLIKYISKDEYKGSKGNFLSRLIDKIKSFFGYGKSDIIEKIITNSIPDPAQDISKTSDNRDHHVPKKPLNILSPDKIERKSQNIHPQSQDTGKSL